MRSSSPSSLRRNVRTSSSTNNMNMNEKEALHISLSPTAIASPTGAGSLSSQPITSPRGETSSSSFPLGLLLTFFLVVVGISQEMTLTNFFNQEVILAQSAAPPRIVPSAVHPPALPATNKPSSTISTSTPASPPSLETATTLSSTSIDTTEETQPQPHHHNKRQRKKNNKGKKKTKSLPEMEAEVASNQGPTIERLSQVFSNYRNSTHHPTLQPEGPSHCGTSVRQVDEIQIHAIGWRRTLGLQRLLTALETANYTGWEEHQSIPLFIHVDGNSSAEVQDLVQTQANWSHGPKHVTIRPENVGLREMWISSIGGAAKQAGNNTLMVIFEDDIQVSPAYFQWLLAMMDQYARTPECRPASLVGFSLSPIVYQNMYMPFYPWDAQVRVNARYATTTRSADQTVGAYLSAVPSSWGAAYWSDRWMEFDGFVRKRMAEPFFYAAEDDANKDKHWRDLRLSPRYLHIKGGFFNNWTKSWKRFMLDLMHARGWVMLYPSLPGHEGLASSAQDDGVHGTSQFKNRYAVDLVQTFRPETILLPSFSNLAVFALDYSPISLEMLQAMGHVFLQDISHRCSHPNCTDLLTAWHSPASMAFERNASEQTLPHICAADSYTPVASWDAELHRRHQQTEAPSPKYLVLEMEGSEAESSELRDTWARSLGRTLVDANSPQVANNPRPYRSLSLVESTIPPTLLVGEEEKMVHVELSHLFPAGNLPSLSHAAHYFGGCEDQVLAIRVKAS